MSYGNTLRGLAPRKKTRTFGYVTNTSYTAPYWTIPRIPIELISHTVNMASDAKDYETLKSLSVIHSRFTRECQRHIFRTIRFEKALAHPTDSASQGTQKPSKQTIESFAELLRSRKSRHLAYYVKTLEIYPPDDFVFPEDDISYILGSLRNVTSFELGFIDASGRDLYARKAWDDLPQSVDASIFMFLNYNPIERVKLSRMNQISLDFVGFPDTLKTLELDSTSLDPPNRDFDPPIPLEHLITDLNGVNVSLGYLEGVFALSKLRSLDLKLASDEEKCTSVLHEFLISINQLEHLAVEFSCFMNKSLSGLVFPSDSAMRRGRRNHNNFASLRSISITLNIFDVQATVPFFDLERELERLSGPTNPIEEITLILRYDKDEHMVSPQPRFWDLLRSTFGSGFPRLRKLKIGIELVEREDFWVEYSVWRMNDIRKMLDRCLQWARDTGRIQVSAHVSFA